jgi:hypothetical protein
MNRTLPCGMAVVACLLLTTTADAQYMKVKMVQGGHHLFHHHGQKLKYVGPAYGAPIGFGGQAMFVQGSVGAQGINFFDLLRLIGSIQPPPGNGGTPSDLTTRLNGIDSRISALDGKINALTTRVEALESKTEENRRTRILVEQHDEILKRLWENHPPK